MVCYIYCKINDRELMINEDDPKDVKLFSIRWNRWRQLNIHKNIRNNYSYIIVNIKKYVLHRLNYFAWNQSWNIHDGSNYNHIDHIDRNRLNNHISNLRVVTNQQNNFNAGAKGYSWSKIMNSWRARIKINYKEIDLGYFEKEEDARKAYLEAKKIYHII